MSKKQPLFNKSRKQWNRHFRNGYGKTLKEEEYFAKNTFGKREGIESDVFDHVYDCDLLIIDDLGTELSNSFTVSQLFVCLNERILRRKATVISTNLTLDDINSIYSERIFSRISSNYMILRLTGDDIRIQKKLLNLGGTNDATP